MARIISEGQLTVLRHAPDRRRKVLDAEVARLRRPEPEGNPAA
jgi:hypothetical protein